MAPKILKTIFERYRSFFDHSVIHNLRNGLRPFPTALILIIFGITKLLIPLFTHPDFELHRDEFLYLAMADHLDWGYLEVPPGIAIFAWIAKYILGGGFYAVRFLPALSGALTIYFVLLITREFGGSKLAQWLAVLCYIFSMLYLRINLFFQPVTFNLLFYVIAVFLFIRILKTERPQYWILLGFIVGFGILIKYTILLFVFGISIGLLITPYRRFYLSKWLWISVLIAIIIWLPNLLWQHSQDWPFFEHMRILSERQLSNVRATDFILVQLLMNLHAAPVWILGLFVFLFSNKYIQYRPIVVLYLVSLFVLILLSGKVYYLSPAYPMLFAAGGVVIDEYFTKHRQKWLRYVLVIFIIYNGFVLLPIGIPVFSVNGMISYFDLTGKYLGTDNALIWEDGKKYQLPQDYADMLGWEAMVEEVAKIYHSLPAEDKKSCAIFTANYGQAGAIDYYGNKYNLPRCISKGSSYWLWGFRKYDGKLAIIIGFSPENVKSFYGEIAINQQFKYTNARESGMNIILAREPKMSMDELWQIMKQYRY